MIVGQAQPASIKLLLEDPVLLHEVLNDLLLAAAHPARDGDQKELERLDRGVHPAIVGGRKSMVSGQLQHG
ncbi:MAG: hypothetical protein DRQ55_09925 [Planctomycetota bacterium]|nr:MAG: hypothetical protein DRQ55_09925 [Planctomycetota bacterium]